MLKKLAFSVVALAPAVAMAGDGGSLDGAGLAVMAFARAAARLLGML
jgi:hypothetical protein